MMAGLLTRGSDAARLPSRKAPSGVATGCSPLTVAGAVAALGKPRTAFPFHLPDGRTIFITLSPGEAGVKRGKGSISIMHQSSVTLVLGGARSGKSAYAESLIQSAPPPWWYLATAEAHDDEMRARITSHQARRPPGWITHEFPIDLPTALGGADAAPVMVDCLTLWLANLLLGGHDIDAATGALITELEGRTAPTVLVANEVGLGIVPDNALARRFRDAAGRLNQQVAEVAERVVFMVAGLPMIVKEMQ
jgi:adenosylcobinamide kinase/adenosylcobinamide-phosphate guanylyltransferase